MEIVDRETEARFAVSGCGTLVEPTTDAIVLFDIGGGSSEIVLLDVSKKRSLPLTEQITAWTSLPVGVVTLAERFGEDDISVEDFEKMKSYVRSFLNNFSSRHKLGALAQGSKFYLLGTSGTITTLAGMRLNLERYNRRQIGWYLDE
ncbi:exopolyphosphatase/pppGpp-phosphohydrolase [Bartonella callosciuri]|uniref:Exopolyphosphatase/pppGpp-phosphohydrolase n=1 Tax=Bartonella callosciuri TaxID=686223 RepID=A0A840NVM3_9HYPH|nr:exopolyphosphatase/pppGpp-phosphohydrolase [Bartonella callosciuri]